MTDKLVSPRFGGESQSLVAALLVFVAKGDGTISDMETDKMLALVEEELCLPTADALALLTDALSDFDDKIDLDNLRELSSILSDQDKEDIVLMLLKVIAADGRKDAEEMDKLNIAADVVGISPEVMHRAYDRYFAETFSTSDT